MNELPQLRWMPRANRDIDRCIEFVAGYSWGRPEDRKRDLFEGILKIRRNPKANPVCAYRRGWGLEYRRQNAAQFVIIYVYIPRGPRLPYGMVSIRAVRHSSERDVFWGVRQVLPPYEATSEWR
jgi:plasmid stabilization system protein ParE